MNDKFSFYLSVEDSAAE